MASPIIWQKILALFTRADATDQALSSLESSLFDKIYPVGSIYISTSTTNPSVLFGGTWEAISAGRVLVQADTNHALGNTGGNRTITLTTAQLPAHTHQNTLAAAGGHSHSRGTMNIQGSFNYINHNPSNHSYSGAFNKATIGTMPVTGIANGGSWIEGWGTVTQSFTASNNWSGATSTVDNHNHTLTNASVGSGSAVNIEQPWLAVNMWKRTA